MTRTARTATSSLVVFAGLFAAPAVAMAEDAAPATLDDVSGYYAGERTSAYVALGLGLAAAGTGSYLFTRDTDFASGAAWPLVTIGGLEALGAIAYAIDVGGRKAHYEELFARDPSAFQKDEGAHIHGTTSRFFIYRLVELGLTVGGAGAATYGFVADKDAWKGAGIALAAIGLPLLVMDTINNDRALRYQRAVDSMRVAPQVGVGREGFFGLSIQGAL